jgi:hypothetical protein
MVSVCPALAPLFAFALAPTVFAQFAADDCTLTL